MLTSEPATLDTREFQEAALDLIDAIFASKKEISKKILEGAISCEEAGKISELIDKFVAEIMVVHRECSTPSAEISHEIFMKLVYYRNSFEAFCDKHDVD